jgi:type IX secretion system PorP/SprF family membrane protein
MIVGQNNIHYSQFYNSPMTLNPALTGQFNDMWRLTGIYRAQWSGLGGEGQNKFVYQTPSGSLDFNFFNRKFGVGFFALNDQTNQVFNTIRGGLSLSYSFKIGDHILSFGTQGIYSMSSLDQSKITTVTPESYNSSTSYMDVNTGINFRYDYGFYTADIGIACYNLLQPKETFLKNGPANNVPMYFKTHLIVDWELNDNLNIQPGIYGGYQAGSTDFLLGSNLEFKVMQMGSSTARLYAGLWARSNKGNVESLIPALGLGMGKMKMMFTYDYNLSFSKGGSSNYVNGMTNTFELSLIVTGKPTKRPPLMEDEFILNPRY